MKTRERNLTWRLEVERLGKEEVRDEEVVDLSNVEYAREGGDVGEWRSNTITEKGRRAKRRREEEEEERRRINGAPRAGAK